MSCCRGAARTAAGLLEDIVSRLPVKVLLVKGWNAILPSMATGGRGPRSLQSSHAERLLLGQLRAVPPINAQALAVAECGSSRLPPAAGAVHGCSAARPGPIRVHVSTAGG